MKCDYCTLVYRNRAYCPCKFRTQSSNVARRFILSHLMFVRLRPKADSSVQSSGTLIPFLRSDLT